jgi:hypothetical protein
MAGVDEKGHQPLINKEFVFEALFDVMFEVNGSQTLSRGLEV